MPATSKTIVRMWNKDGYHKDVAILDSDQVRMTESRVEEPSIMFVDTGYAGQSIVIDPTKFPEAVRFQIIVQEYKR